MLEVNDFDAVRISLASPEQIRSWSYGEVTKPETMNYRTLKPERDGLFCERIFGPIKDFECSCGKYRRIRYKGVICDKCGVEVARSKVRRERMGHIDLASPVAHIWFAKGIPSRLGLLLDMSPRNLERVLYFSHFVVTRVDQTARDARIAEMEADCAERIAAREAEVEAGILEMPEATVEDVNLLRRNFLEEKTKLEEGSEELIQPLRDLAVKQLMNEILCQDLLDRFGEVFEAEMGADAILSLVRQIDLDALRNRLVEENQQSSGQRRRKLSKQLRLVEALRRSSNKPDWMVLTVLPVLPPDLRPMIQLDGGRFATSDLNDLYRRVINRNNRLRHLLDMGAPEIIIRNEKRMLQEAVDSLIDNGRRGRAVSVSGNHQLKSLSDMLRGKHGRFRQNLLGKRVDYSGRSVIVVGPELELHQCGLPRRMALELFKPFVMNRLVAQGLAHNIKSARRLVEKARPEVYDILEEVVHHRPVLLNRAPTLHRLSIQAFEVVLIDGAAIQLHPLVCSAFNADFDGDQMAVHVPLSKAAVHEAREMMLSTRNMLLPSSGEPIVTPTLDMVLGCYYLTCLRPGTKGEGHIFGSYDDARLAYDLDEIDLGAEIEVREPGGDGGRIKTSIGRIIFNAVLPPEIGFQNKVIDKSGLKSLVSQCWRTLTNEAAANVLDRIKELGFHYATISGTTIAASDIKVPATKPQLLAEAETRVKQITSQFQRGLITEDERYAGVVEAWMETTDRITEAISENFDRYGGVYIMANSGAKGNISQIRQMAGMRGLMTNPSGRIIDFPIKASLREGLGVLEYFISTHGARKGLADTALRTSSSGYLTRRLIDVAQDLIILDEDCGTTEGIWMTVPDEKDLLPPLAERINARLAAAEVRHPETDEILLEVNQEIDEEKAAEVAAAGVTSVMVRSPLTCQSRHGVCRNCYGRDLARAAMVAMNTAVGIVAAQSIGEPGTQLTLRTFHTGGVVGIDITTGLPRVEELFEARPPRNEAIISEIDGEVTLAEDEAGARIKVASTEIINDEYPLPKGYKALVKNGQWIEHGELLAQPLKSRKAADKELVPVDNEQLIARVSGQVRLTKDGISLEYQDIEEREYPVPALSYVRVRDGSQVHAGQQLTEGSINPQHILHITGREAVQKYLVDEVQRVYRSQGVNINDKHIEVIARQMLTKVIIDASGDTDLVPGEIVARYNYEDINAKVLAEGGEPATAHTVLLGITRASLNTDSWLAAASFQETTRVLADAAVLGKVDHLIRLKENVIIGRLIPARLQNMPVDEPAELPGPQVTLLDSEYVEELDLSEETWTLLTQSAEDEDAEVWPEGGDDEADVFADIVEADVSADAATEGADDADEAVDADDTVDEPALDGAAVETGAAEEDA